MTYKLLTLVDLEGQYAVRTVVVSRKWLPLMNINKKSIACGVTYLHRFQPTVDLRTSGFFCFHSMFECIHFCLTDNLFINTNSHTWSHFSTTCLVQSAITATAELLVAVAVFCRVLQITPNFHPPLTTVVRSGIRASLRAILDKRVLQ